MYQQEHSFDKLISLTALEFLFGYKDKNYLKENMVLSSFIVKIPTSNDKLVARDLMSYGFNSFPLYLFLKITLHRKVTQTDMM